MSDNDNDSAESQGEEDHEDHEAQENPVILPALFYHLQRNDEFMMKIFRSVICPEEVENLEFHHDFFCPFLHPTQTHRRPYGFKYSPKLCPRIGNCPLGDQCGFSHNIYEYCLHPRVYLKSNRCFDGESCMRFPCLFPHNPERLRAAMKKPPLPPRPRPLPPPLAPLPPLRIPPPRQGGRASRSRSKSV